MTLNLYEIRTDNGARYWHAADEQHAIEQHNDAFLVDNGNGSLEYEDGEQIKGVRYVEVSPHDVTTP